jgi:hypothetical protein
MQTKLSEILATIVLLIIFSESINCQTRRPSAPQDNRAVIVVTGFLVHDDTANYGKDVTVAEGALVRLTSGNGKTVEKKTEPFPVPGERENDIYFTSDLSLYNGQREVVERQRNGEIYYTADFGVMLDSTYNISMTFKDGTVITVDNYRLPAAWKTHFSYHGTTGLSTPASVLRIGQDQKTKLRCYVYALYPLDNYKKFGGRQVN